MISYRKRTFESRIISYCKHHIELYVILKHLRLKTIKMYNNFSKVTLTQINK